MDQLSCGVDVGWMWCRCGFRLVILVFRVLGVLCLRAAGAVRSVCGGSISLRTHVRQWRREECEAVWWVGVEGRVKGAEDLGCVETVECVWEHMWE